MSAAKQAIVAASSMAVLATFSGSILVTVVSIEPSAKSVSQIRSALASSSGVHSSRYCMAAQNSPPAWTSFLFTVPCGPARVSAA